MKKPTKKIILTTCIILLLVGAIVGVLLVRGHMAREEAVREQERLITEAYFRVNYAFGMTSIVGGDAPVIQSHREAMYSPLSESDNKFGISAWRYLLLKMYEIRTGIILSYEVVIDYFSQEFEPDGSLRLYNNGKHPEIEAFVTWMWEGFRQQEMEVFLWEVNGMFLVYRRHHNNFIEPPRGIFDFSPQMLDALVRAYADPQYVLDLTSLQRAGY